MSDSFTTKKELEKGMEEMHLMAQEVEKCRQEFRKVQDKYNKLVNSAPDALVFVNADGKILVVNAQFENMFGYSHDEMKDKKLDLLVPERFRDRHRAYVSSFFSHPKAHPMGSNFEIYALRKNGEEFPVDITLSPMETDEGLLTMAAIRDITKRKEAEEQVEKNYQMQRVMNAMLQISLETLSLEVQFERILDLILSVPYVSLQSRGAIYMVDDENPEVLTLKAQQGFLVEESIPCKNVSFGMCLCGKAAQLSEIVYSDHLNNRHEMHNEGTFPHGHYCVPILSGKEVLGLINVFVKEGHKRNSTEEGFLTSVASTVASIIKHDKMERERKRLQNELAEAEKLAALGRFTANVAHEIRNPLTAIGGFARRLDKNISRGTKEKEYANFIISEVARLEGILKNILSFSREAPLQFEESNITDIIDTVLKLTGELCREKGISVHTSYNDLTPVYVDRMRIHEAVENIVLNAVDAMAGGTLDITVDNMKVEGKLFKYVEIRDTGPGIERENLDVIFEPFYSTKVAQKGTGLGLSITKKIMEQHGGFIRVKSSVGKGTTFMLYLSYDQNKN